MFAGNAVYDSLTVSLTVDKANVRDRNDVFVYPYNLGWRRNVSDVLLTWNSIPKGNGVWWPIVYPTTQFTFSVVHSFV